MAGRAIPLQIATGETLVTETVAVGVRITDPRSGLVGIWNWDGTPRQGDLTRCPIAALITQALTEDVTS